MQSWTQLYRSLATVRKGVISPLNQYVLSPSFSNWSHSPVGPVIFSPAARAWLAGQLTALVRLNRMLRQIALQKSAIQSCCVYYVKMCRLICAFEVQTNYVCLRY